MKAVKRSTRIVLALTFLLAVAAALPPSAESAGSGEDVYFIWESTAAAAVRTAGGDCPPGQVCKELCIINSGGERATGTFDCFPG